MQMDGHNEEYHPTTSVWKTPASWHWTGHCEGYWQQGMVEAKQGWWGCL